MRMGMPPPSAGRRWKDPASARKSLVIPLWMLPSRMWATTLFSMVFPFALLYRTSSAARSHRPRGKELFFRERYLFVQDARRIEHGSGRHGDGFREADGAPA